MVAEIEAEHSREETKNPLRHFLPLEVPSFRSENATIQRSVAVSLTAAPLSKKICARPGAFLNERQALSNPVQTQLSSGPGDYSHLVYRAWEINFDELELKEAETQPDNSLADRN